MKEYTTHVLEEDPPIDDIVEVAIANSNVTLP